MEKKRPDFETVEEYIKYLELRVEYQTMKESIEKIRKQLKSGDQKETRVEEAEGDEAEGAEEAEGDADITENSEDETFSFLKGHEDSKNPGKLVVGKQRFTSVRTKKTENGFSYNYQCAVKAESKRDKGRETCKASLIVETNEDGSDISLRTIPRESEHSHVCEESQKIKWEIISDIQECFSKDETVQPSLVRKKTILKFQVKYRSEPDLWQEVLLLLPSDQNIDKQLRKMRLKRQGKVPKTREDIDIATIIENLKSWKGENVMVLDSDEMWQDETFRNIFKDEEGFDTTPERVLLFTTPLLLTQLANSPKWSQVNRPLSPSPPLSFRFRDIAKKLKTYAFWRTFPKFMPVSQKVYTNLNGCFDTSGSLIVIAPSFSKISDLRIPPPGQSMFVGGGGGFLANWPPRLTPVWTPGKFRCGKLGPSIIYIYIGYILPTIQEYMSVDFIYWYWVYSDNNWGIYVNSRMSVAQTQTLCALCVFRYLCIEHIHRIF